MICSLRTRRIFVAVLVVAATGFGGTTVVGRQSHLLCWPLLRCLDLSPDKPAVGVVKSSNSHTGL